MWNFTEATSVDTISYAQKSPFIANEPLGTFFAPNATVSLARKLVETINGQRHISWLGSLIAGAVVSENLYVGGLTQDDYSDSNDPDSLSGDVVDVRGNGQINQFSFQGWLPVPFGTCGAPLAR